jgi:hypothetical protein
MNYGEGRNQARERGSADVRFLGYTTCSCYSPVNLACAKIGNGPGSGFAWVKFARTAVKFLRNTAVSVYQDEGEADFDSQCTDYDYG